MVEVQGRAAGLHGVAERHRTALGVTGAVVATALTCYAAFLLALVL